MMLYTLARHGDDLQVTLSEALMFSDHERFREVLNQLSDGKCKRCVFDLSGVTSVDSAGLGMLMLAYRASRKHHFDLMLQGPTGQVKRLIEITDLSKVMPIH